MTAPCRLCLHGPDCECECTTCASARARIATGLTGPLDRLTCCEGQELAVYAQGEHLYVLCEAHKPPRVVLKTVTK